LVCGERGSPEFRGGQVISEGQAQGEFSDADPMIITGYLLSAAGTYVDHLLIMAGANLGLSTLDQMIDFCITLRAVPKEARRGSRSIQSSIGPASLRSVNDTQVLRATRLACTRGEVPYVQILVGGARFLCDSVNVFDEEAEAFRRKSWPLVHSI
jgi:hypothetical protein